MALATAQKMENANAKKTFSDFIVKSMVGILIITKFSCNKFNEQKIKLLYFCYIECVDSYDKETCQDTKDTGDCQSSYDTCKETCGCGMYISMYT